MNIDFIDLKTQYRELKNSIDERIHNVLNHGQYILGPEVQECEKALCDFTGSKNALTVANGTDALLLALMAIDVKPGDEVIVPGFSFIATAEMIVLLGATPVFVDICKDTFNIDVQKMKEAITAKTKAIIPVGLYGQPADMDEINALAEQHKIVVIEDAAQSFGSEYKGRRSGSLSTIGCTSFFPAKPLGCYGDGGAVFTSDDQLHEIMTSMRMHGQAQGERYKHPRIGLNARMDTIQCAVVLAKLEKFSWEIDQRQKIAARYSKLFADLKSVITPNVLSDRSSVFAQYTLWLENREKLQAGLKDKGVPTAVHYPLPMYRQPAYERFHRGGPLAVCDWAAKGVISLPMHPYLDEGTQDRIVSAIKGVLA